MLTATLSPRNFSAASAAPDRRPASEEYTGSRKPPHRKRKNRAEEKYQQRPRAHEEKPRKEGENGTKCKAKDQS
nr:MAG TPA: hypothetical protein [Caudoviricetes sp.]